MGLGLVKRSKENAMLLERPLVVSEAVEERRLMRRFEMRLPATVRLEGSEDLQTETENVSARGVFFRLPRTLAPGARLEITLTFPPHVRFTEHVRVRFTAHVVRIEDAAGTDSTGVAAAIEQYEFLRARPAQQADLNPDCPREEK
jgi:hypothetical protein